MGPFLNPDNPKIKNGILECSFEEFFKKEVLLKVNFILSTFHGIPCGVNDSNFPARKYGETHIYCTCPLSKRFESPIHLPTSVFNCH